MIYWDHSYNMVLAINMLIVIGLFTSLRLFSGTIAHINASNELLKKDNPAFGVSLAGVTFGVTLLLSGTVYGTIEGDILESALSLALYGVIGIILMAVTRLIFDKIALPNISLRDEIIKGNMAVAIADTANVIAAALILRAVMIWITDHTIEAIGILLAVYAISQIILTLATFLYLKLFKVIFSGRSVEDELSSGNIAVGLSFAGGKIMTALGIAMASQYVVYELYNNVVHMVLAWAAASVLFIIILKILALVAERIILFRTKVSDEILIDRNIAIGAFQAVIYISMGILLAEL